MSKLIHLSLAGIRTALLPLLDSRLARLLMIIVFIKFIVFYGFLKGFLYPRFLRPQYENELHRSEQVMRDLINTEKLYHYDRKH